MMTQNFCVDIFLANTNAHLPPFPALAGRPEVVEFSKNYSILFHLLISKCSVTEQWLNIIMLSNMEKIFKQIM